MPANTPEELQQQIVAAITGGDINTAVTLYERDAALVPEPGTVATGTEAIRGALEQFMATEPQGSIETTSVLYSGDLALIQGKWKYVLSGPDGNPLEMSGTSAEVARRQADGTWKYVLDDPFAG